MKPLGMDKNRVLVYEGDKALYNDKEWNVFDSTMHGFVNIVRGLGSQNCSFYFIHASKIEVVNVSDRTNYERYFADLCSEDKIWNYICQGVECEECVVSESLCSEEFVLSEWMEQQAVKL